MEVANQMISDLHNSTSKLSFEGHSRSSPLVPVVGMEPKSHFLWLEKRRTELG